MGIGHENVKMVSSCSAENKPTRKTAIAYAALEAASYLSGGSYQQL
jgi:hypothetical protein